MIFLPVVCKVVDWKYAGPMITLKLSCTTKTYHMVGDRAARITNRLLRREGWPGCPTHAGDGWRNLHCQPVDTGNSKTPHTRSLKTHKGESEVMWGCPVGKDNSPKRVGRWQNLFSHFCNGTLESLPWRPLSRGLKLLFSRSIPMFAVICSPIEYPWASASFTLWFVWWNYTQKRWRKFTLTLNIFFSNRVCAAFHGVHFGTGRIAFRAPLNETLFASKPTVCDLAAGKSFSAALTRVWIGEVFDEVESAKWGFGVLRCRFRVIVSRSHRVVYVASLLLPSQARRTSSHLALYRNSRQSDLQRVYGNKHAQNPN